MARQGLTRISDKKKGWFIISEPQVALIQMESGGCTALDWYGTRKMPHSQKAQKKKKVQKGFKKNEEREKDSEEQ